MVLLPYDIGVAAQASRRPLAALGGGDAEGHEQRDDDEHEQPLPQQPRIGRPATRPRGPGPRATGTAARRGPAPLPERVVFREADVCRDPERWDAAGPLREALPPREGAAPPRTGEDPRGPAEAPRGGGVPCGPWGRRCSRCCSG